MFGLLIKIRLRTYLNSMRRGEKKKRRRRVFGLLGLSLVPLIILINLLIMYQTMLRVLPNGAGWLRLLFSLSMAGLFLMQLFGGLAVVIHSLFFSKDLSLLLSSPLPLRKIFQIKLIEAAVANSALYFIIGLPMIIAFGIALKVSLDFYLLALLLSVVFITLPVGFGAALAIGLVSILPAKKAKNLSTVLFALFSMVLWAGMQFMRPDRIQPDSVFSSPESLQRLTEKSYSLTAWMPSQWLAKALFAYQTHDWGGTLLNASLLLLTAGALYLIAMFLLDSALRRDLFSGGFAALRKAAGGKTNKNVAAPVDHSLWFALWLKDIKLLVRDSRHAMQIFLYGVIMIAFPLIGAGRDTQIEGPLMPFYSHLYLFLFAAMMASSWASRLIPAEGLSFSYIKCAPQKTWRILFAKFSVSSTLTLVCGAVALIVINSLHRHPWPVILQLVLTLIAVIIGANGVGIAVGASFPNFTWDHPKRMLSGGGNMIYMISVLLLMAMYGGILILGSLLISINLTILALLIISTLIMVAGTHVSVKKLDSLDWLY